MLCLVLLNDLSDLTGNTRVIKALFKATDGSRVVSDK